MRRRRKPGWRLKDERGSVAVEFGLIAPIFFLLVFGIIDFGRAFYTSHDLAAAVREAGRFASTFPDPLAADVQPQIRARAQYFALSFGGEAVTDAQIDIEIVGGSDVTVRIRDYPFDFIVLPMADINMTREATFRLESASTPAPAP
jgi:Flp pilus assembly protein TadG